ncbi:hypothetical protein HME9302_02226 [Alteripontixanthobacter maritimus]|uniref:Phage tail assembly chaperone n=1 Tax=Alteripontixanthobacter maritimus TaxID=2161824 RepID=A0A369QDL2_9SPHN|nr:phage tail assembly chaperone [Alteripontixanthobacter maritimus]RDC61009.1 hypothetical protein HME9302_02226 [Alteripontixanthobacter maritimus]
MTTETAPADSAEYSDRFAPGTLRLAGLAARALGWRPAEFWQATPAELLTAIAPMQSAPDFISRADLERLLQQDTG